MQALRAGKHVYSAVPMAISEEEIAEIIEAVRETGLTYMMGETSYYNPATVFARKKHAEGAFGRIFYAEGDYVHDMDLGFYDAYQYSGGEDWKRTASYPPMLYPTHSVGGVLGATGGHAVSVSCVGVRDERGDGVFDREVSMFANDFSNATRPVRTRRRRVHAHQRVPPGRLPLPPAREPLPLLRHRGQLRTARPGQRLAGQARRDRHQ